MVEEPTGVDPAGEEPGYVTVDEPDSTGVNEADDEAGYVTLEEPVSIGVELDVGVPAGWVRVSVTGQTVVETAMVTVVTAVEPAGQLGTSGPQLVMVWTEVVKTVEVVM